MPNKTGGNLRTQPTAELLLLKSGVVGWGWRVCTSSSSLRPPPSWASLGLQPQHRRPAGHQYSLHFLRLACPNQSHTVPIQRANGTGGPGNDRCLFSKWMSQQFLVISGLGFEVLECPSLQSSITLGATERFWGDTAWGFAAFGSEWFVTSHWGLWLYNRGFKTL